MYTNDQSILPGTCSFVYADDLAVTTQCTDFAPIEETLTSALGGLSEYYTTNQLRANRECGKQLNISWNGVKLTHCNLPVYFGVTMDRTLSYKAHIEKTKKKVDRNNKQHHPQTKELKMGSHSNHTQVVFSSAMLLSCRVCLPCVGTHNTCKDTTLNEASRMITGCLKPTNTNSLSVLAEIAPSDIRRAMASRTERTRQTTAQRHPFNGYLGVVPRLNSRKSFIKCYEPINTTAKAASLELWRERLEPL